MMQWLINFARWITTGAGLMPLLADAVLKATALLVVAWLASLLFRRSSAAMRHLVWTVALVGSLALPLLLPVVPRWSVPLLPQEASPATFEASTSGNAPATLGSAPTTRGDAQLSSAPVLPKAAAWSLAVSPTEVLMAIWGTVAIGLLVRLIYAMGRVRPLARRAATGAPWLPLADDLAARSGVARRVTFVEGPADTMPMTWGFWRPVVLVPEGAGAWPESRLRTVLLHELAHVARYDCLTQTVAGVVCAIYWFNPLAWMAASRLVTERERACDDAVLAAGADGPDYAEQLLDVARAMRPHGVLTWASVSMARRSQLEGRLLAILDPDLPRRVPTRATAAVFAMFLIVLVPSLAAIEPVPRASATIDTAIAVPQANSEALISLATDGAARQALGQAVTPRPTPQPAPTPMPTPTPMAKTSGPDHDAETRPPVEQKVIDALTAALKDVDAEVREHVVMALGSLHDRRATAPLIGALADSSADLRESAAMALGQLQDPAAVEPLVALLADKAPNVREQAAFALGQLGDPRAVEPLLAAIADANTDVREQAAFALGQIRDARATDALIAAMKDANADVRKAAAFALSQVIGRQD
jgi:beta-lactamase regulating signal transducer with metallopeptidase domain